MGTANLDNGRRPMATRAYERDGITIHFEARRCIHAAECVQGLPTVFDADARPWITPAGGSVEEIAAVVERCPSGALTYVRSDGGPQEAVPAERSIRVVRDGPLHVRGALELGAADGAPIRCGPRAALCRCGASKNKPFCDNSHLESGFTDAGTASG